MSKYSMETKNNLDAVQLEQMRRDYEQSIRRHYQTRPVAVWIPLLQALIPGTIVGLIVGISLYLFGVQWKYIFAGAILACLMITLLIWSLRIKNWQELVWNVETALQADLTGDGVIGQSPPAREIHAVVSRNNGKTLTFHNLHDQDETLVRLMESIRAGEVPSEARWTPARNGFSKSDYWHQIHEFIRAGVLAWKNLKAPEQGVMITADGPRILEQWLNDIYEYNGTTPLPRGN